LVSIILCTYNGERFLQAQLDSLLQQSWQNLEIIISDDASSDDTRNLLATYAGDKRFRIFLQPENLGPVANFEFAIRQAKGEWLAFCDQDDIWLPEKIERMMAERNNYWLVYSDSILVDENGNSLRKKLSDLRMMYSGADTRGFVFSNTVWGHAMLVSRELIPHVLPIPPGIPHDIWLAMKATIYTGILYIDEALTLYRQHSHTVTTTIAQKAVTRARDKRYNDFETKLNWIGLIRDAEHGNRRDFYSKLYDLFCRKANGNFVWPLFFFLLRYQSLLFRFTRKPMISRIIEIRKISRGERKG
jgi:glycosyltransferase involved in cell wall biosynthesis